MYNLIKQEIDNMTSIMTKIEIAHPHSITKYKFSGRLIASASHPENKSRSHDLYELANGGFFYVPDETFTTRSDLFDRVFIDLIDVVLFNHKYGLEIHTDHTGDITKAIEASKAIIEARDDNNRFFERPNYVFSVLRDDGTRIVMTPKTPDPESEDFDDDEADTVISIELKVIDVDAVTVLSSATTTGESVFELALNFFGTDQHTAHLLKLAFPRSVDIQCEDFTDPSRIVTSIHPSRNGSGSMVIAMGSIVKEGPLFGKETYRVILTDDRAIIHLSHGCGCNVYTFALNDRNIVSIAAHLGDVMIPSVVEDVMFELGLDYTLKIGTQFPSMNETLFCDTGNKTDYSSGNTFMSFNPHTCKVLKSEDGDKTLRVIDDGSIIISSPYSSSLPDKIIHRYYRGVDEFKEDSNNFYQFTPLLAKTGVMITKSL